MKGLLVVVCAFAAIVEVCNGHGMMLDPPNRSSLWRFDAEAPINYNDNQNFCGGFYVQWYEAGGKCGVCGDAYNSAHPQDNENTGKYGKGKIVASYQEGSIANVSVLLTANHKGYFNYSLCMLRDGSLPEEEDCFFDLALADGSSKHPVSAEINEYNSLVVLPYGIICERCVLRWTYTTGNNWGLCEDGSGALGCGPQETFRGCADIAIYRN